MEMDDDGLSGKISFSTPDLSDDDSHSPWMPDQLKCDACTGIAYQIWSMFDAYNQKRPSLKYNIKESELLDMTEELCIDTKGIWQGYGMKEVKKVKRISGKGTEVADTPGITAGGGKWPARMADMCDHFMGELGEETIYDVYRESPKDEKALLKYLCYGTGVQGECTKSKASRDEL